MSLTALPPRLQLSSAEKDRLTSKIVGGSGVNLLGIFGRFSMLLFWIAATRLYGMEKAGEFAVAYAAVELCRQFTVAGLVDGLLLQFSRAEAGGPDQKQLRQQALSTTIWMIGGVGALLLLAVMVGAGEQLAAVTNRPAISDWALILAISIPLLALAETLLAAIRSLMIMKWHALVIGWLQPVTLLVAAAILHLLGYDNVGLALAWLISCVACLAIAIPVFAFHFGLRTVTRAVIHPQWDGTLMRFVLPQNLNLTFNHVAGGIDILLLAVFQLSSSSIALYTAGVQLTRNLRSLKAAIGASFGPVIARLHQAGELTELGILYDRFSRLALLAIIPPVLLVILLRQPLLSLFDPAFAAQADPFMPLLLCVPVVVCAVGLSGNLISMTGHSSLNLAISVTGAVANIAFAQMFIPSFGLAGAAGATLAAIVVVQSLNIAVVRWRLGIRTRAATRIPALLAGAAAGLVATACEQLVPGGWWRALVSLGAVLAFAGIALAMLISPEERQGLKRLVGMRDAAQ